MSVALFVTYDVPTSIIDQVLEEAMRSCSNSYRFFVVEPEDVEPLDHEGTEGTKFPIRTSWQTSFQGYTPQQCSDYLKELVPEPFPPRSEEDLLDDDDDASMNLARQAELDDWDDERSPRRFAILDKQSVESGKLLACNRELDDSVTSVRMAPKYAALHLDFWDDSQWKERLRIAEQQEQYEAQRRSRRAALARHLASAESSG